MNYLLRTKILISLVVFLLFTGKEGLYAQSNTCSASTAILSVNPDCINDPWTNNDDNAIGFEAPCNGANSQYEDIWYLIEGNGQNVLLTISGMSAEDATLAVYTSCPTTNAQAVTMTAPGSNCSVITGASGSISVPTSFGTNYYVQIQRITGAATTNQSGSICATNSLPNGNAACGSAQSLPVTVECSSVNWTNNDDNALAWESPSCTAGSPMQDIWYSVTGTGNDIKIDISNLTVEDATLTVFTACPTDQATANALIIPGTSCVSITGATGSLQIPTTLATTYYIQIQRKSASTTNDQSGEICAYQTTPCGNPAGLLNDFCENSATLTEDPASTFSASTSAFSADHGILINNLGVGCVGGPGNIIVQNNSWYEFTANSVTETFAFTYTECAGVQALVYRVTKNALGCCVGLVQMSNCISSAPVIPPGAPANVSIVTATGLTPTNQYVLMIDGFSGAQCDYTLAGWSGTGILPIELTEFSAVMFDDKNMVTWKTASEHNNDYFNLYRSFDGEDFEVINVLDGAGNSTELLTYNVPDYQLRFGTVYYQLEQVDFDGKSWKSAVIVLDRKSSEYGLISIYPNPTETLLTVDINVSTSEGGFIRIESINGSLIYEQTVEGKGIHQLTFDMEELGAGMYFVRYLDAEVNSIQTILKK